MEFTELDKRTNYTADRKLAIRYTKFDKLIYALQKKDIPPPIVGAINLEIDQINAMTGTNKDLCTQLGKAQFRILKLVEKELKLVPRNHYRLFWLSMGVGALGIPFGFAFGMIFSNTTFLTTIISSIGAGIGFAFGILLDKKAVKDGKQLDFSLVF